MFFVCRADVEVILQISEKLNNNRQTKHVLKYIVVGASDYEKFFGTILSVNLGLQL
jgi:hypothetical protein